MELKIMQKTYDLALYHYPALRQFPKSEKHTMAAEIKKTLFRIMRLITRANKARRKRRLKALMRKYQRGEMDWQAVNQSVQSYFGILKHCNSYRLRNAILGPDGWFVLQRGETECFELNSVTLRR